MGYILIITMHADPAMAPGYQEWGGTHTYMKELLDGLGSRKLKCIMVTRKSMPLPDIECYNDYCTIYRIINGDAEPMDKALIQNFHDENINIIQEIINTLGIPTIIHSVYWNSGRIAMELSKNCNVNFVHSVISNSRGRRSRGATEPIEQRALFEQVIYDSATAILCVSNHERQDLIEFYRIDPGKIYVVGQYIHNAFILPARDSNGFPRLNCNISTQKQERIALKYNNAYSTQTTDLYWSYKVFTYMGRISLSKGVNHIIEAWYLLYQSYGDQCPGIWIVGGSIFEINEVRDEVKKNIPDLDNLEKIGKIVWWGYLDAVGLSTILLKTLVLITHSQYEPGGRVIVEAMIEGVPVLATNNGFAKDYIRNWRNGFITEYGNIGEIFLKLEHFVRQPFLANALGQNARQDAKEIIREWSFLDSHIMLYGLEHNIIPEASTRAHYDYYKMRNINLYPYYNIPLSEEFIKSLFEKKFGQSAVRVQSLNSNSQTSYISRVEGVDMVLIFKQTFTRLSISPLFNPFSKEEYVRDADTAFRIELETYKRANNSVLCDYDTIHQLIVLKELKQPSAINIDFLKESIQYIMLRNNLATVIELETYYKIMHNKMDSFDSIKILYKQLNESLPNYYFEVSGIFCEKLAWAESPHLLKYNRESIPSQLMRKLEIISDYFYSVSSCCSLCDLRNINLDTKIEHFLYDSKKLRMLDHEKNSIGSRENEIACLLHDYFFNYKTDTKEKNILEILKLIPSELNMLRVIEGIAYRCFYDIQMQLVMNNSDCEIITENLEILYRLHKQKALYPTSDS